MHVMSRRAMRVVALPLAAGQRVPDAIVQYVSGVIRKLDFVTQGGKREKIQHWQAFEDWIQIPGPTRWRIKRNT